MFQNIMKKFLRPGESLQSQTARTRLGTIGSGVGVGVNALLAGMKLLIGTATGSVAVTADAANNLSDAAGSVMSLISMRLASKPVDRDHPFGHGRLEYLGALGVGVLILVMGVELLIGGVESILHPAAPTFSWVMFSVLLLAIALKGLLFAFYQDTGSMIDASALLAAAKDSLSDVLATSAVAASMLIGHFFSLPVDGWMGVIVSLLVLRAGWEVCRDTVDSLLGGKPDQELGRRIVALLEAYDQVLGSHDLIIHDYGPGRCFASVHAEVPADGDLIRLHEMIDRAEHEIGRELNVPICIHMDPVVTGDAEADCVQQALLRCLEQLGGGLMMHDLRRVPGEDRINLVFDVVIPAGFRDTAAVTAALEKAAQEVDARYRCVINFDVDYYHS